MSQTQWNSPPNSPERRQLLLYSAGLISFTLFPARTHSIDLKEYDMQQLEIFAAQAQRMRDAAVASGDQPYGAVVTKGREIIGWGPSRVIQNQDPTAHAEMEAIRDAARKMANRDLSGCLLISTSPPCRMCETAAYWANIGQMFHGDHPTSGGTPGYGC